MYWAGAVRQLLRDEPDVLAVDPMLMRSRRPGIDDFTTRATTVNGPSPSSPSPRRGAQVHGHLGRRPHRRAPARLRRPGAPEFADRAPRVVEKDDGSQTWLYDGVELPNVGFNAVVGRPVDEYGFEPARFDEMRRGAWDIDARIADMDLNGIYASLNFPSFLPGFAGQRLQLMTKDPDLAMAVGPGLERLAPRGVGRHPSRPHHPLPDPVAARPRGRRGR